MGNTFSTTTATAASTPAGHYAALADVYAVGGKANVVAYSDLDGTGVEDADREQAGLNHADTTIDSRLRFFGIAVPVPATSRDFRILTDVAARLALCWLYDSRGILDEGKDGKDKMQVHRDFARNKLAELTIPGRLDASYARRQPTQPTTVTV